jgi:hypothetical protein
MEQTRMSKFAKVLGGGGLAAVLALVLAGIFALTGSSPAQADTPPNPPSRFAGTVTIDGAPAPLGTVIEARINGNTCAEPVLVFTSGADRRYVIDVFAFNPGQNQPCGSPGSTITFHAGALTATQTGSWDNSELQILNLTFVSPTPTPTATATGTAPAATATKTPGPPKTGAGMESTSSGSGAWLLIALGLGAAALGAGGVAATRRAR